MHDMPSKQTTRQSSALPATLSPPIASATDTDSQSQTVAHAVITYSEKGNSHRMSATAILLLEFATHTRYHTQSLACPAIICNHTNGTQQQYETCATRTRSCAITTVPNKAQ